MAGLCAYSDDTDYLIGLLNTKIVDSLLMIMNPTLNYPPGTIANIPVIIDETQRSKVETLVKQNIAISKADWDSRETSWDFEGHPLL